MNNIFSIQYAELNAFVSFQKGFKSKALMIGLYRIELSSLKEKRKDRIMRANCRE